MITEIELVSAKITRTRYDGKIHTFCPHCDTYITSFSYDLYDKIFFSLSKVFTEFGCSVLCYYEGNVEFDKNAVDYKPPIFRLIDTEDMKFYKFANKIKQLNEILDDIYIIDEGDGSFSIVGGVETWYFDEKTANRDLKKYLTLVRMVITMLINYGKKYMKEGIQ
jgi:hypothetical protein